jgi:hypothetical protein
MNAPPQHRNRRTLYLLMLLFFGPLLVSFALYYGSSWRPAVQTQHGELYTPARPLPQAPKSLQEEWSLVYVGDAACDEACRETLVFGRQVRLSLNQEMARVRRVLLSTAPVAGDNEYLATEHAGLVIEDVSDGSAATLLAQFAPEERANSLFVVDPRGNLVMRYDARQEPKGLLTDLKKLLKLSHIG